MTLAAHSEGLTLANTRVGGVTYLNAWPVLYGLMLGREPSRLNMAFPAVLAQRLCRGETDIALAPVATLALRQGFEVAPRICIGADGPVSSVLIVSERPVQELDTLLLDSQSKTSVVLSQLVAAHLRGGRALPVLSADYARIDREAHGKTGALVIGDRALEIKARYAHVLDLGEAWKAWTGLPFVFAAWIAPRGILNDALYEMLERSLAYGLSARREIAHLWASQHGGDPVVVQHYLTHHIRYGLLDDYRAGLHEFLARAHSAHLLDPVELSFFGG
ncbi:MAG TPA: menaquinone biosynthesis protein [Polyangiales bacterium]|nr:menaquinone biosynthesis protein [Polyangiales bacterium]